METFSNMKGIRGNLTAFGDQLNPWRTVSFITRELVLALTADWLLTHELGRSVSLGGAVWPSWQYLPGPIEQTLGEASRILLTAERPLSTDPSGGVFSLYIHAGSISPVYSTFSPRFWFCFWLFPHKPPWCSLLTMISIDLELNHFPFLVKWMIRCTSQSSAFKGDLHQLMLSWNAQANTEQPQ